MAEPAPIRASDMRLIEDLFEMHTGYVLDFSNRTFAEFFRDELGINIDLPRYAVEGTSKGKRLRYLLRSGSRDVRARTLKALWEYREARRRRESVQETIPEAEQEFRGLLSRVSGEPQPAARTSPPPAPTPSSPSLARIDAQRLMKDLVNLTALKAQERGYAFERFLRDLFNVSGLAPRASFRLVGEQIDGSFQLAGETYLLEAKWQADLVGASDLRSFNGKVEDKAAWSRGLFVSNSGFSEDGLSAFGRGKRVVCMDGLDLYDLLDRNASFADVVARKVRRAAETGMPFIRVRDLYM